MQTTEVIQIPLFPNFRTDTLQKTTKRRPRPNRNRYLPGKHTDATPQPDSKNTMRFESNIAKDLEPPPASQLQGQGQGQPPLNESRNRGRSVQGNRMGPSSMSSAAPITSQSQAQVQSQSKISPDELPFLSRNSNPITPVEAPVPHRIRIPSPPPFSSVKFTTIGQQPELLKRFSDFAPGTEHGVLDDGHQSASPEPDDSIAGTGSGLALESRRRTLLQALGGSEVDMDTNMDVDPSGITSSSTTGAAANANGTAQYQSLSQASRAQYSSDGDRSARSLSQSRKSSNGHNSNGSAITTDNNISTNANTGNSTSNRNRIRSGSEITNTNSTSRQDSTARTPDLLYPPSSRTNSVAIDKNANDSSTHSPVMVPTSAAPNPGPNITTGSGGTSSISNLLALRTLLNEKTVGLRTRAARERERDAGSERENIIRNSARAGLGSPPNGSASGQDVHMREQDDSMHPEPNTDPSFELEQPNATVSTFRSADDDQRRTLSPMPLDAPSQARRVPRHVHAEGPPHSRASATPTPSSNGVSTPTPNIVAGDNVASTSVPFSQHQTPARDASTVSQISSDALDSALSSAKQWFDDMARARSEIQALLARATAAESTAQSLRSELALSRSESASFREQVSSSSALLTQAQTEKTLLQEQMEALQAEMQELRSREEEERNEREVVRQEVEQAVKVSEGIMEYVDAWVREVKTEQEQEEDRFAMDEERERIAKMEAETDAQARLAEEEKTRRHQLETQLEQQRQQEEALLKQREQEEANAAAFARKRAEVMKEKERANQENAQRIRAAREVRSISGGVMLSTLSTTAIGAPQADSGKHKDSDAHTPQVAIPVPAPASNRTSISAPSPSARAQSYSTPSLPSTSQDPSSSPPSPSNPSILRSGEFPVAQGPVQVSPATQFSNLRHLREARLGAVAKGLKPAHIEAESNKVDKNMDWQEDVVEEQVDVKMEDNDEGSATSVSHPQVNKPIAPWRPSPRPTVQMQVESETLPPQPSSRRPSLSHSQDRSKTPVLSESTLPQRPPVPLPRIIPPSAPKAIRKSPQTDPSSGSSSFPKAKPLPKFTKNKNAITHESFETSTSEDLQPSPTSRDELRPLPSSAAAAPGEDTRWRGVQSRARSQTPEPVINSPLTGAQAQKAYFPPSRNVTYQQRGRGQHYSPPLRQLIPPPAMLHRRVSDHYSPPPASRARHYSSPSPPRPGRIPESRKRRRPTYLPNDEHPARRPWPEAADSERVIYKRPSGAETPREYAQDDTPNGPQTPPRPAPWEHASEPEQQPQYDPQYQARSPSPMFRGRTLKIANRESYRAAFDPESKQSSGAPLPINAHPDHSENQKWERRNAEHVSETYESNPGVSVPGPLSSRMDIDHPEISVATQRHPSPHQECTSRPLLDRMSDSQRLPPSGPAAQIPGYFQSQNGGNNNHIRRVSNQTRGSSQRGQSRGSRPARGRSGGRGNSAELSNSERQPLAARISSSSTLLQDRLS
jgi:hypothetical protein